MVKKITTGNNINLTKDQVDATAKFLTWLSEPNLGIPFVLSGYAGSGKTFLSIQLLKKVEKLKLCWTVVAPTHKAVGVLRTTLFKDNLKPTWHPSTIHRLLRLKLKRKNNLEICSKTNQTQEALQGLGLVLIDEASMIDSELLAITLESAQQYKTRVVFVGDPAQLAPIGEKISPIFSMKRSYKAHLNEVVRHQGSILKLANNIRNDELPCEPPPFIGKVGTRKSLVSSLDKTSWLEKAKKELYAAAIEDNPDATRILCYTNKTLERLVPYARRAIHGKMADEMSVLPGEVLITHRAIMGPASVGNNGIGEEPDMILGSNRELIVLDISTERIDVRKISGAISNEREPVTIETFIAKVRTGEFTLSIRLMPPTGSISRKVLDEELQNISLQAKSTDIKEESKILWRSFFLLRDSFASVGPAAVLTVHRSQGSTFGQVFIASDIFWPNDYNLKKQLTYVAVSRAKEKVWLISDINSKRLSSKWSNFLLK